MDRAEVIKELEAIKELEEYHAKNFEENGFQFVATGYKKGAEMYDMAIAALREQEQREWISDRLPTEEECNRVIVGVVNGYSGRITFTDAEIFVCYDFKEKDWYSEDYDIEGCKVRCWYVLPEPPKEGAEG